MGGANGEKRRKGIQEQVYIKDTWTKLRRSKIKDGKWGWLRWGYSGGSGENCT